MGTQGMRAADRITTVRIILAPVFFVIYNLTPANLNPAPLSAALAWTQTAALWIILIAAELTDMLDGMAARRRGEVSDFGKFYDPFADTLTQVTLFFCFVRDGILPSPPFLLILYREFGILFIRNLMLKRGISQGARMGGKIKTVAYIAAAIAALAVWTLRRLAPFAAPASVPEGFFQGLSRGLPRIAGGIFYLSVLLALISFADYIRVYRRAVSSADNPR
jgi:CDP-diacylglycerol--glycerol-3-phosphate 3-phosphatidyltransferase